MPRAKMSDRSARLPISQSADPAGACGVAHANAALAEARAILQETEPFVACRDTFHVGRESATEHSSIGPLAMCSPMYQVLSDALRAFVEEEE